MKDKITKSSTGSQLVNGVRQTPKMEEFYKERKATDWHPIFREFLSIKSKDFDRHSTPHYLYSECADWYKATGKEFRVKNKNLTAWIDYLKGKGLL